MEYHIKTICQNCHKEFYAYKYNIKKGFGKYCSKSCSNKKNNHGFKPGHKHYPFKDPIATGKKISKAKKGIKFTEKHKEALRIARIQYYKKNGYKKCNKRRRKCKKCYLWRKAVFERDDYTCQMCFKKGIYIEADHIKSWRNFPKLRHTISNGRTLCKKCHEKTPNYKSRAKTELSN